MRNTASCWRKIGLGLAAAIWLLTPPAWAVDSVTSQLESTTEITHQWPDAPVTITRKLSLGITWSHAEAAKSWKGKITQVTLNLLDGQKEIAGYSSAKSVSKPAADLPVEIAGYAALVGAEVGFSVDAEGVVTMIEPEKFIGAVLDKLGAPNAPIRQKALAVNPEFYTTETVKSLVEMFIPRSPGQPRAVPGYPELTETASAPPTKLTIAPKSSGQGVELNLGSAKMNMQLTGEGEVTGEGAVGIFAQAQTTTRNLTGTVTILEKRPDWTDLPANWPVTIKMQTKVTSTPAK